MPERSPRGKSKCLVDKAVGAVENAGCGHIFFIRNQCRYPVQIATKIVLRILGTCFRSTQSLLTTTTRKRFPNEPGGEGSIFSAPPGLALSDAYMMVGMPFKSNYPTAPAPTPHKADG